MGNNRKKNKKSSKNIVPNYLKNSSKYLTKVDKSKIEIENEKIKFDFKYFQQDCVKIDEFNNKYQNEKEITSSMKDLLETLCKMCDYTHDELFSPKNKKEFHLHTIKNDKAELTRNVLTRGYNMPNSLVEQFENLYFGFSYSDGKRAVAIITDNIISLLFLDPNHLIYSESSRYIKNKKDYHSDWLDTNEKNGLLTEKIKKIINSYYSGKFQNSQDIINELKKMI